MTPFVKCYDGLIKSLEDAGYEQGENFFVYNYDWRKSLDSAADELKNFLDNHLGLSTTKVNLVGHSLGGMVARSYSQKYGIEKIDKLITVGSPHSGALQPYLIWEGGQINLRTSWQEVALQLLLEINKTDYQTNVLVLRELAPSIKDIMPTFNFLKRDSVEIDWQTLNQKNDYLNGLQTDVSQIFDPLAAIFGTSGDTPRWYQVENPSVVEKLLGKWEDGKPVATENDNGDQTILSMSAQISGDSAESLDLNHRELIEKEAGIKKILQLLGISEDTSVEKSVLDRENSLIFLLASPASLKVTAPGGTEFTSDEDGFVVIDNPQDGDYQTEVTPIGDGGDYHLYLGQLTREEDLWTQIKENVGVDETDTFEFEINSESPTANPLVDLNGLDYLQLVKSRLLPLNLPSKTMSNLLPLST